jgi:hypothetical protein
MERTFTAELSIGDVIWHKSCGTRGVIIGYSIDKKEVMYRIDYGVSLGVRIEHRHCISAEQIL